MRQNLMPVPVVAGEGHSCGLTTDGDGYCWGSNWAGQLGSGGILDRSLVPVLVGL